MAENLGTVGIIWAELGLKQDAYLSGMRQARATAESTARSITQTMTRLTGVGIGLYAVKRAVDAVTDAFVEFDKHMHNIWTLVDATKEQMASLSNEIRDMARQFNVSASRSAQALYQIYSATFYGASAMRILEASMKGAAAGLSDVYTAANMTTTVLNAYRMEAEKATHVNDLLFTAIRFGKTTYAELSQQFGRLAGVAAPAGARIEEMTAAIATLTRQGIMTDWAVTSLRQTIMQILRPGKELQGVITDLGYASGRAMVEALGFAGAVGSIGTYADRTGMRMEELFSNVRAVTAVLPLATTAAGEFRKDLGRMADATGAMTEAFEKAKQSWAYQMDVIKTSIQDAAISMGKVMVPAVKTLMDIINVLARTLGAVSEVLKHVGGPSALALVVGVTAITLAWKLVNAQLVKATAAMAGWIAMAGKAIGVTHGLAASMAELSAAQAAVLATNIQMAFAPVSTATMAGSLKASALRGVSKLSPLGMLGYGLGSAMAIGTTIQGLVNLNLEMGKVSGAEKVKLGIADALKTSLGPLIGGAILGKLFLAGALGPGMGALVGSGIGAAVAGAAALTIYVVHVIRKAAEAAEERQALVREQLVRAGVPTTLPSQRERYEYMHELLAELSRMNPEIENTTEFFSALRIELMKMYEYRDQQWQMSNQYRGGFELAKVTGMGFDVEESREIVSLWRQGIERELLMGLETLPAALSKRLPEAISSYVEEVQSRTIESFEDADWDQFGTFISDKLSDWAKDIDMGDFSPEMFAKAIQQIREAVAVLEPPEGTTYTIEETGAALKKLRESFDALNVATDDQRIKAFVDALAELPDLASWVAEAMGVTVDEAKEKYKELLTAQDDTGDSALSMGEQVQKARNQFEEILDKLAAGDLTLVEAGVKWEELQNMVSVWTTYAEIAEASGWDLAEQIRALADDLEAAAGSAEKAQSAIERFTEQLRRVSLTDVGGGTGAAVAGLAADLKAAFAGRSGVGPERGGLGPVLDILSALESGVSSVSGAMEGLQQIANSTSALFGTDVKNAARAAADELEQFADIMGKTDAQIQSDLDKAAREAKQASERAAQEAKQRAEEAFRDAQEAFRNSFTAPIEQAMRTGDFMGAAEQIREMGKSLASLINKGAALDMTASDVLSMLTGAQQQLVSTIDGLIQVNAQLPEMVEALQYAKGKIEEFFAPAKSALEQELEKLDFEALLRDPTAVATKLKELAEQDLEAVAVHLDGLRTKAETTTSGLYALGFSTTQVDDALMELEASLRGINLPFKRLMESLGHYAEGINELIDALLPKGLAKIVGKFFNVLQNIPMLGDASVVMGPTLALVGENGPELTIPLSDLPVGIPGMSGCASGTCPLSPAPAAIPYTWPTVSTPAPAPAPAPVVIQAPSIPSVSPAFEAVAAGLSMAGGSTAPVPSFGFAPQAPSQYPLPQASNLYQSLDQGFSQPLSGVEHTASGIAASIMNSADQIAYAMVRAAEIINAGIGNWVSGMWGPRVAEEPIPYLPVEGIPSQGGLATEELRRLEARTVELMGGGPQTLGGDLDAASFEERITNRILGLGSQVAAARGGAPATTAADAATIGSCVGDAVGEALESALDLTPGSITPQKPKGATQTLLELLGMDEAKSAKWAPFINSTISAVIEVGKQLIAFAREGLEMAETAFKDVAKAVSNTFMGALDRFSTAMNRLASNMWTLISSTETYSRLQQSLSAFLSRAFDALMGWAWPLIALFEQLSESVEETIEQYSDLNVPTGYKVTRAEWAAAKPGEPGELKETGGGEDSGLPEWVVKLLEQFADAIEAALAPIKAFFDLMSEIWEELGPTIFEGILPSLQGFGEALLALAERIRDELLPVLKEHLAGVISGVFDLIFGSIVAVGTFIVDTLIDILPNLELFALSLGELGGMLPGLASALSDALSPAINTLLEGLTLLTNWITATMIPGLSRLLTGFGEFWKEKIGPFFTNDVFPKIMEWVDKVYNFVSDKVVPFLETKLWPFMESELWPMFTDIVDSVVTALTDLWDNMTSEKNWPAVMAYIKGKMEEWGIGVVRLIELTEVKALYDIGETGQALKALWESESIGLWDKVKISFGIGLDNMWQNIKDIFGPTVELIVAALGRLFEVLSPVISLLALAGGAILKSLNVALTVAAFVIDRLTDAVKLVLSPFRFIAVAIHNFIEILKHPFNPGARDNWSYYASGGVVTQPTLAVIGEAGPEAVVPLTGANAYTVPGFGRLLPAPVPMISHSASTPPAFKMMETVEIVNHNIVALNGRVLNEEITRERRHREKLMTGSANGRRWERVH